MVREARRHSLGQQQREPAQVQLLAELLEKRQQALIAVATSKEAMDSPPELQEVGSVLRR